jgi:hypothetical protein
VTRAENNSSSITNDRSRNAVTQTNLLKFRLYIYIVFRCKMPHKIPHRKLKVSINATDVIVTKKEGKWMSTPFYIVAETKGDIQEVRCQLRLQWKLYERMSVILPVELWYIQLPLEIVVNPP